MEPNIKIEKLRDKDNWHQWRFVVRTLMEEDDDVLDVCEGRSVSYTHLDVYKRQVVCCITV